MGRREPRKRAHVAAPIFILLVLAGVWGWMGNDVILDNENTKPSASRGTRVNGFLMYGKRMPVRGRNFRSYSRMLSSFGRTCVNSQVRDALIDTYDAIAEAHPDYRFVFGETGWCDGGGFWPHRTHQNGLSVDFMVPVKVAGRSEWMPSSIFDGFGYALEFDDEGRLGEVAIDFEAIVVHLEALQKAAKKRGLKIERVIFDPKLQQKLFATKGGKRLKRRLDWNENPAWVRHDDHYHVDFLVEKDD